MRAPKLPPGSPPWIDPDTGDVHLAQPGENEETHRIPATQIGAWSRGLLANLDPEVRDLARCVAHLLGGGLAPVRVFASREEADEAVHLAVPPRSGKSRHMRQLAEEATARGERVAFFSPGMHEAAPPGVRWSDLHRAQERAFGPPQLVPQVVAAWIRALPLECLEDAESACANHSTREAAAEALRAALLLLAEGRPAREYADRSGTIPHRDLKPDNLEPGGFDECACPLGHDCEAPPCPYRDTAAATDEERAMLAACPCHRCSAVPEGDR